METETEIPCTKDDKVKCTHNNCNKVSVVKDLRSEDGHKLSSADKTARDQTIYFYCPFCDDPLAKVFDWGNGNLVLVANVELVKSNSAV